MYAIAADLNHRRMYWDGKNWGVCIYTYNNRNLAAITAATLSQWNAYIVKISVEVNV